MYNIKAAAHILNMPKVTIRSWETRYNAITPARTESGHRLYSDQNLEDLQWLKIQVQTNGIKISEAVKQLHSSKRQPINKVVVSENFGAVPYSKQVQELYLAASEMDTERFTYLLDLNFSMFHHHTVFFSIITPLMVRIGEEWESGAITVAHEHLISHIIQQRFNQFFRIFPTSPDLPKVIALCPSGEQHELGLLLFTLFLREKGYPVLYFGQNTPIDGLSTIVQQQNIGIVCMSITKTALLPAIKSYIDELSKTKPELEFLVGGQGIKQPSTIENTWFLGDSFDSWQEWLDAQKKPLSSYA